MAADIDTRNSILNKEVAQRKLRRMAFQIAEDNYNEPSLLIAGINGNGEVVAKCLAKELQEILSVPVQLITIKLNKKQPQDAKVDDTIDFNNQNIIIVDDVSNTGKTLLYAIKPFLNFLPKKIQTLVLVERSHKQFSIQPDYVGLSVTTTLQEHISVETSDNEISGAWLH